MEKLIELLNEYIPAEENCSYELYDKWVDIKKQTPQIYYVENTYAEWSVIENQTLYFISKKGGFIKWLVENDKIDRDEIIINSEFMPIAFDRKWEKYEWSEEKQLLMLLSISDTPIEDLISYLK